MMKLGGRCIVETSRPSSHLGPSALGAHLQKFGVQRWENQRRLSSYLLELRENTHGE